MSLKEILTQCYENRMSVDEAFSLISDVIRLIHSRKKVSGDNYVSQYNYSNDKEFLDKLIDVYSLVVLNNELTKKERDVLKYYLKSGYSDRVKTSIRKDLKITGQHMNQLNWKLTNKGFLMKHPTNDRSKVVNSDLIELKKLFLSEGQDQYTIIFNKTDEKG